MDNQNKCTRKCDFKSVIKGEYECVEIHPPLWSEYWYKKVWNCECNGDACMCLDVPYRWIR